MKKNNIENFELLKARFPQKVSLYFYTSLLSFILLIGTVIAQNEKKGIVGASIGPSFAIGKFNDKSMYGNFSGGPKSGWHAELSFDYKFTEHLGLAAMAMSTYNPVEFDRIPGQPNNGISSEPLIIESDPWFSNCVMLGPSFSQSFNDVEVVLRLLGGIGHTRLPSQSTVISGYGSVDHQSSATATSFAYDVGLGMKYNISNRIGLLFNVDYYSTKPIFEIVAPDIDPRIGFVTTTRTVTHQIQMINLGLGIGIRI